MSDRLKGVTVVFDSNMRDDDAEAIINAIKMIRGVVSVEAVLTTPSDYFAEKKAKKELADKLWQVLYPTE